MTETCIVLGVFPLALTTCVHLLWLFHSAENVHVALCTCPLCFGAAMALLLPAVHTLYTDLYFYGGSCKSVRPPLAVHYHEGVVLCLYNIFLTAFF